MNYTEALNFIHSRMKFGSRPGMERISALCEMLGNPQDSLKFVHVAGTNGKGSTCGMIASVLKAAGYKTGLFTSPYVLNFRERIQINGEMIPESELAVLTGRVRDCTVMLSAKGIEPTEFEIITAIGFLYFLDKKCDVVVLEAGLGGLLDSTNIIKRSEVSVITSISLDHTEILGDTLLKIAEQKCGIFKEGGTVVSYPQADFAVERYIKDRAKEAGCEFVNHELSRIRLVTEEPDGSTVIFAGCTFKIPLTGKHQLYNFATAVSAINVLKQKGYVISAKNLIDGVSSVRMPARFEKVSDSPVVIIDGGHNPEGVDALKYSLEKHYKNKEITAVMAMMKDKDYGYFVKTIAPLCTRIYTTTASNPRSLPAKELAAAVKNYCRKVKSADECEKAYSKALKHVSPDGVLLVCGSLYLASDIEGIINAK